MNIYKTIFAFLEEEKPMTQSLMSSFFFFNFRRWRCPCLKMKTRISQWKRYKNLYLTSLQWPSKYYWHVFSQLKPASHLAILHRWRLGIWDSLPVYELFKHGYGKILNMFWIREAGGGLNSLSQSNYLIKNPRIKGNTFVIINNLTVYTI